MGESIIGLDTDVLVAAFIERGLCAGVFERVVTEHQLVVSRHIPGESQGVKSENFEGIPIMSPRSFLTLPS